MEEALGFVLSKKKRTKEGFRFWASSFLICVYQRHVVYVCFPWSTCTQRGSTFFPAYIHFLADLFLFYNVMRRLVKYKREPPSPEQQGKSPKIGFLGFLAPNFETLSILDGTREGLLMCRPKFFVEPSPLESG